MENIVYLVSGFIRLSTATIVIYYFGCLLQNTVVPMRSAMVAENTLPEQRSGAYSLNYLSKNMGYIIASMAGGILMRKGEDEMIYTVRDIRVKKMIEKPEGFQYNEYICEAPIGGFMREFRLWNIPKESRWLLVI